MPEADGRLTREEFRKADRRLTERVRRTCPACGGRSLSLCDHLVASPAFGDRMVVLGGAVYPQVMVTCLSCGCTLFFNAVALGVVDANGGQAPNDGERPKAAPDERRSSASVPKDPTGERSANAMTDSRTGSDAVKPTGHTDCLVVTDVQHDFMPGGALAVPDGDAVVPVIARLMDRFPHVVATQDWHPRNHHSFASSHSGREPFETIEVAYGPQTLWPDHCVQGSHGAEFHPDVDTKRFEMIIRKGFRQDIDSYSAFRENDRTTPTGLAGYLRERGFRRLFFVGLATDYCVRWSIEDACSAGFEAVLVEDACRAIDLEGSLVAATRAMRDAGAAFVQSRAILA